MRSPISNAQPRDQSTRSPISHTQPRDQSSRSPISHAQAPSNNNAVPTSFTQNNNGRSFDIQNLKNTLSFYANKVSTLANKSQMNQK